MTSESNGQLGRPPLKISPEVMEELLDARLTEQIPWKELPTLYKELTGEERDWRTLRRTMLRDAAHELVPGRVSRRVKETVEKMNDEADMMQMILIMLRSRFSEWLLLNDKRMQASMDSPDSGAEQVKFTVEDRYRMDDLWNDIQGFFFKATAMMTNLHGDSRFIEKALMSSTPGEVQMIEETDEQPALSQPAQIADIIQQMQEKTQKAIGQITQRHKEEGRGQFRTIPKLEDDPLEDDG